MNEEIAEICGIILGDGHLHKKENCITIVGSIEDYFYHINTVIPLFKSAFRVIPKLKFRKDRNAIYTYFYSKEVMDYLTKQVGLVRGNKINAKIPRMEQNLIPHFMRGLFDTDGCLKFSKQTKKVNYYPRLQLAFKKSEFADEINKLLTRLNFNFCSWDENRFNGIKFYQISGKKNLEKWIQMIDMRNPVHKTKYLYWKRYGHIFRSLA